MVAGAAVVRRSLFGLASAVGRVSRCVVFLFKNRPSCSNLSGKHRWEGMCLGVCFSLLLPDIITRFCLPFLLFLFFLFFFGGGRWLGVGCAILIHDGDSSTMLRGMTSKKSGAQAGGAGGDELDQGCVKRDIYINPWYRAARL